MHILYIHQHFATPSGSTGTRSYEFARRWTKAGHNVTMLTGHYDIGGLEPGKGLIQEQVIEGIRVIVVGIKYSNKQPFPQRIISFFCFILLSIYAAMKTKGVDVIYATSTPLTVGIPALVVKWFQRTPFVFEVRDQWPEIPIELGIIKNKFLTKALLWLERLIYKNSEAIVALSPGIAEGVRHVNGTNKLITTIPNSCDTDLFRPGIDSSIIRKEYDWGDKLVFLHAGAMGKVNGLEFIIDTAERLKDQRDITFVLIGDGNQKDTLRKKIKQLDLNNVEILDPIPKAQLPQVFAACDVSMVIVANFSILEHNSANKFFDSLSAGKPVLLNYSGWQRKILEDNAAGYGCDLYNTGEFVEKVLYFNSHRDELSKMGQNARRVAIERFDRSQLAGRALNALRQVAGGEREHKNS
jgi:glycosyltransferase involved in cell wall biosynthesis